jgi:hypothetical protein
MPLLDRRLKRLLDRLGDVSLLLLLDEAQLNVELVELTLEGAGKRMEAAFVRY